jgi:hypothetical protein
VTSFENTKSKPKNMSSSQHLQQPLQAVTMCHDRPVLCRPPAQFPPTFHGGRMLFLHPGYAFPGNVLITLPRVDPTEHPTRFGIHHRTALLTCQIIANNAFETGFLAHDVNGERPVEEPLDGVVAGDQYYFVVRDDSMSILTFSLPLFYLA